MVPRDKSDYLSDVFYYDFSFQKQNMKRLDMLLITLAVVNSFPLKNEENAALKTKVMFYHKSFGCFRWAIMFIALI